MGIYLFNMKMLEEPTPITIYPDGRWMDYTDGRHGMSIEIPPHGRLIDTDVMKESIRKQTACLRLVGGELAVIADTLEKGWLQEIDNASTIIPAEPLKEES